MKFGCVIFDEQKPDSGWSCIAGAGEQPMRITGFHDLRSDVTWWTSLEFQAFTLSSLNNMFNMKSADYLRTSMNAIREEIGLSARYTEGNTAVSVLAELFFRVMTMAELQYGLDNPKSRKLAEDLRPLIFKQDASINKEVDQASEMAHQAFVKCTKSIGKKTRRVPFRRNRYQHSIDVLSTPIPGEGFEFLDSSKLPPKAERVDWLLKQNRPVLLKGAVVKMHPQVANVVAFGGGSHHNRNWISHPELLMLSEFVEFDIESAFLFEEYQPLQLKLQPPSTSGFGLLSMSVGLLSENYWIALATPQTVRGQRIHTPRAAWLRASDRLFTMLPALKLHSMGVQIDSYGVGLISADVDLEKSSMSEAIQIGASVGLCPPYWAQEDALISLELS